MAQQDPYSVLGVVRNASDVEIKRAFRKKARQFHPDRNPDDASAESKFKEVDNQDRACKAHTGYWDFGHSGFQTTKDKAVNRTILWEQHLRCCGGELAAPGCKFIRHKGPLLTNMPVRVWKWPDQGAKRYFVKKTSKLWQEKPELERLEPAQVARKFRQYVTQMHCKDLPLSQLYQFCMSLHLHIL